MIHIQYNDPTIIATKFVAANQICGIQKKRD